MHACQHFSLHSQPRSFCLTHSTLRAIPRPRERSRSRGYELPDDRDQPPPPEPPPSMVGQVSMHVRDGEEEEDDDGDWVEDGSDDDEGDATPPPPPPPMDDADMMIAFNDGVHPRRRRRHQRRLQAHRRCCLPAGHRRRPTGHRPRRQSESMLCTRIIMPVESLTTLSRKHGGCRCAIFFPTPGTKPRTNASHYCVCEETGRKSSQTQPSCCCDGSRNARPSSRRARRASSVHEFLGTSLCHLALRTPCWASAARSTWTHFAPFTRTSHGNGTQIGIRGRNGRRQS